MLAMLIEVRVFSWPLPRIQECIPNYLLLGIFRRIPSSRLNQPRTHKPAVQIAQLLEKLWFQFDILFATVQKLQSFKEIPLKPALLHFVPAHEISRQNTAGATITLPRMHKDRASMLQGLINEPNNFIQVGVLGIE
jgi:hypothetical protein